MDPLQKKQSFHLQKIIQSELESVKSGKQIFVLQPNSHIFFLSNKATELSKCKQTQEKIKKEINLNQPSQN